MSTVIRVLFIMCNLFKCFSSYIQTDSFHVTPRILSSVLTHLCIGRVFQQTCLVLVLFPTCVQQTCMVLPHFVATLTHFIIFISVVPCVAYHVNQAYFQLPVSIYVLMCVGVHFSHKHVLCQILFAKHVSYTFCQVPVLSLL